MSQSENVYPPYNRMVYEATHGITPDVVTDEPLEWSDISSDIGYEPKIVLPSDTLYEDGESRVALVGLLPKGDDCGHIRSVAHDGNVGTEPLINYFKCGRRDCSYCYSGWSVNNATDIARRLIMYRELVHKTGRDVGYGEGKTGMLHHFTLHPPEFWSKDILQRKGRDGLSYIRTVLNRHIKEHGLVAGVSVYHAFGIHEDFKERYMEINGDLKGVWTWLREEGFPEGSLYYYPHFHVIAYGMLDDFETFMEETTMGRGVHKGERWRYSKARGLVGEDEIRDCVNYCLSHSAIQYGSGSELDSDTPTSNSFSWFGDIREVRGSDLTYYGRRLSELDDYYYELKDETCWNGGIYYSKSRNAYWLDMTRVDLDLAEYLHTAWKCYTYRFKGDGRVLVYNPEPPPDFEFDSVMTLIEHVNKLETYNDRWNE